MDERPAESLDERRRRLRELVERGELEAWKAALLSEWLGSAAAAGAAAPSAAELASLLLDPDVVARLREVSGPWDALVAQARSQQLSGRAPRSRR